VRAAASPLRVAMIIQAYHPVVGGAERQLAALAPLLRARGVDVHVLTRHHPGSPRRETLDGAEVHRLPSPGPRAVAAIAFTAGVVRELVRLRPHVVHAYDVRTPASAAVLAKPLTGAPVVCKILRGGVMGDLARLRGRPLGRWRWARYRRHVDVFVSISTEIDRELDDEHIPPARRAFIPNGVDTRRFAPADAAERERLRADLSLPTSGPVVIYAGRLAHEKRVGLLLQAWPAVHAHHRDGLLVVVGDGPERDAVRAAAGPGVRLVGAVDDVAPWLRAADVFVLPSTSEGLPNSVLEAAGSGLAVVATDVGGTRDVVHHGTSGLLVPVDDAGALAGALRRGLADPGLMQRFGRCGRETVVARFALDATADRLAALYRALAGGTAVAPV
jgi:glycosyltransferase involved in cell wall biosynthesis